MLIPGVVGRQIDCPARRFYRLRQFVLTVQDIAELMPGAGKLRVQFDQLAQRGLRPAKIAFL